MTRNQTFLLLVLTLIYLSVELAFNARLLDVVGGAPTADEVDSIEVFGRLISGAAVALVLLQFLMSFRQKSKNKMPSWLGVFFLCVVAIVLVFVSLKVLVDSLVESSSGAFRKDSVSLVLIQQALVRGGVKLDGLIEDPTLFSKPEGKAFLALFPMMAISLDRLDERIHDAKLKMLKQHLASEIGGTQRYYDTTYIEAIKAAQAEWDKYRGIPVIGDVDATIESQHNKAWAKYLSDLGRHGWTPSTVPNAYRNRVINKVRSQTPVPKNWDLTDESAFHDAVASKVRKKVSVMGVTINGRRIPPGLDWDSFLAHPSIQENLRSQLGLPKDVKLKSVYTAETFEAEIFERMLSDNANRQLVVYESPSETFEDGESNSSIGKESARAVIVPPIALFFSLLGAIGHMAKFAYLIAHLTPSIQKHVKPLWLVPMGVLITITFILLLINNPVTNSRIYKYMGEQVLASAPDGNAHKLKAYFLIAALHNVSVGQGYGYSINETIRVKVLRDFSFGYQSESLK